MEVNNNWDWDLNAVVRSCCFSTPPAATTFNPFPLLPTPVSEEEFANEEKGELLLLSEIMRGDQVSLVEHDELCESFLLDIDHEKLFQKPQPVVSFSTTTTLKEQSQRSTHQPLARSPRPKRSQKKQHKRVVCHVPDDGLSPDLWSWRKYGQKPIKGSPYPRGYYRCSSSKGCMARKQVERSPTDPTVLVVTYTAEHNHPMPTHRNSLAGTTRQKFPPPPPPPPPPVSSSVSNCNMPYWSPNSLSAEEVVFSPIATSTASGRKDLGEEMDVDDMLFMGADGMSDAASMEPFLMEKVGFGSRFLCSRDMVGHRQSCSN
uniref:WRKY domain-containing protein n=1 Tax=Ananas comosus var. bracteatus TaxID=296719 RepID=A0A6V7NZR9_ANACO|nr:unnamed protein product [Ananas comosus var. bracteatus]